MRSSNYQDTITTPLAREHDNNATDDNEADNIMEDLKADTDVADGVLGAIEKVGFYSLQTIEVKLNIISFGRLSRQSVQVLNVVNYGLARSSLCSWKEARPRRIPVPRIC
jgi:hypothetical protein